MNDINQKPRKVAVIGGGIAGIACSYALRTHRELDVHIFEAKDNLGGHADTNVFNGNDTSAGVDTGFIAFNEQTYRMSNLKRANSLEALLEVVIYGGLSYEQLVSLPSSKI